MLQRTFKGIGMSKYNNLSDGKSDGFVMFYLKDGKLFSVMLNKDQAQFLDSCLEIFMRDCDSSKELKITKTSKDEMVKLCN